MSDALQRLIEAVEAGAYDAQVALFNCFAEAWEEAFGTHTGPNYDTGFKAYRGSLDAAKAIHDALLPGWHWCADDGQGQDSPFWHVFEFDGERRAEGEAKTPARAWLIAILAAYQQVQQ